MRMELVRDWMSWDVITITPQTPLPEAEKLMVVERIRRLPVMENGRLVGIVTYGDIRNARPSTVHSAKEWEQHNHIEASHIMSRSPIVVSPEATIGEAAQKMMANMISSLPVLDSQNQLVGIITESDIFRLVARTWLRQQQEVAEPYTHYG